MEDKFITELRDLINSHCKENGSNTPDFVLAAYLKRCLDNWDRTTKDRDKWYGAGLVPGDCRID
jgi:hypothetical protein